MGHPWRVVVSPVLGALFLHPSYPSFFSRPVPLRLFAQVSLPKGKGIKLSILEERAAKIKKAQNN